MRRKNPSINLEPYDENWFTFYFHVMFYAETGMYDTYYKTIKIEINSDLLIKSTLEHLTKTAFDVLNMEVNKVKGLFIPYVEGFEMKEGIHKTLKNEKNIRVGKSKLGKP